MIDEKLQAELRAKYNPDGSLLREMQLKMKQILDVVDDICVRNNIPYWLSSGTLLGAVRHGGFIPWDDDLDIDMLRTDVPRFLKACEKELPKNFVIQTHKTDSNYYLNLIKVRDLNSNICELIQFKDGKKLPVNYKYQGIFIDIIPIEPSSIRLVKFSGWPMAFFNKALAYWNCSHWVLEILYCINQGIFSLLRLLSKFRVNNKMYYVTYGTWFFKERHIDEILPVRRVEFEGSYYNAPKDCHAYLRRIFGNYDSLPKEENRKPLHDSNLY